MLNDNFVQNLFVLSTVVLSDGTTADIDEISIGSGGSSFWFYEGSKGSVKQAGLLFTTWNSDGTTADVVRLSTSSDEEYGLGDSSDLVFSVVIENSNVILRATSVNNWTIKIKRLRL